MLSDGLLLTGKLPEAHELEQQKATEDECRYWRVSWQPTHSNHHQKPNGEESTTAEPGGKSGPLSYFLCMCLRHNFIFTLSLWATELWNVVLVTSVGYSHIPSFLSLAPSAVNTVISDLFTCATFHELWGHISINLVNSIGWNSHILNGWWFTDNRSCRSVFVMDSCDSEQWPSSMIETRVQ